MREYPYIEDIDVKKLRVDLKNPRLPTEPDNQRDALGEMAEVQGEKLLALCRHIARHGLSLAQRFVVIPGDDDQFIVLDGNRRLTALRALEHPDPVAARLTESQLKQLKQLGASFEPVEEVSCVVFANREDADVWVELAHDGESGGAGTVPWSAQQKTRHRARLGARPYHLQALEFVCKQGQLSKETIGRYEKGTYPVSTLERVLISPVVRDKLGIEYSDGQVTTRYAKSEVLKGLSRLVDEIGTGKVKVGAVMSQADRLKYLATFDAGHLPDPGTASDTSSTLEEALDKPSLKRTGATERPPSRSRAKLIPRDIQLNIGVSRINDIYHELKRLKVDDVPNATGVLLRVFLELSVDAYIDKGKIPLPPDSNLARKVSAVADSMENNNVMNSKELLPVREGIKSPDKATVITNLNALAHNRQYTVSGNDLKALWDRLQLFFVKLWA